MNANSKKVAVAWLSVLSNSFLVVLKIAVGLLIGSVSVISEAIHSGVDLLASVIALAAVKGSGKPADEQHEFGHGKLENISGAIEAMLIFLAAGWIVWEAIHKILHLGEMDLPGWGVWVMLASVVANTIVSRVLFRVGRETDSMALQADAWHLRTDVWTSAGVMAGLALIWLGNLLLPNHGHWLHLIDPLAAIIVAGLIVKAAWHLTVQSGRDLMDAHLPEEEKWIAAMLAGLAPAIHGFHRLRSRKAGPVRFIDFHIFVDSRMTVAESHRLAHECSQRIKRQFEGANVIVHVEPCSGQCEDRCRAGCLLTDEQRAALQSANAPARSDDDTGHA